MESHATVVTDLTLEVPRAEVLRLLGFPRDREPAAPVQRALEELWPRATALLQPRGAHRLVSGDEAAAAAVPRPTSTVGIGLCTIGPALEQEAQRYAQEDEPLAALIVDTVGSVAAEAAADALDRRLCAATAGAGLWPERRISPGYGDWDVRYQRQLVALLPAAAVGIELTSAMMMVPRKSVSFAVRFDSRPIQRQRDQERCADCEVVDCPFRGATVSRATRADP